MHLPPEQEGNALTCDCRLVSSLLRGAKRTPADRDHRRGHKGQEATCEKKVTDGASVAPKIVPESTAGKGAPGPTNIAPSTELPPWAQTSPGASV